MTIGVPIPARVGGWGTFSCPSDESRLRLAVPDVDVGAGVDVFCQAGAGAGAGAETGALVEALAGPVLGAPEEASGKGAD